MHAYVMYSRVHEFWVRTMGGKAELRGALHVY